MRLTWVWILIDESGRILLLKRSNYTKMFPYQWDIPGWRWELWENAEEIVTRELKEETQLDFSPTKLYEVVQVEHSGETLSVHKFLWTYAGKIDVQEEEVDGYAWYTYEETQKLEIAFTHPATIQQLYKDWLLK